MQKEEFLLQHNITDSDLEDFDEDMNHYYIAEKPKVYKRAGDSWTERQMHIFLTYQHRLLSIISRAIA